MVIILHYHFMQFTNNGQLRLFGLRHFFHPAVGEGGVSPDIANKREQSLFLGSLSISSGENVVQVRSTRFSDFLDEVAHSIL